MWSVVSSQNSAAVKQRRGMDDLASKKDAFVLFVQVCCIVTLKIFSPGSQTRMVKIRIHTEADKPKKTNLSSYPDSLLDLSPVLHGPDPNSAKPSSAPLVLFIHVE